MKDIALVSNHTKMYQQLADITFKNKIEYAEKYNYAIYDEVLDHHYPSLGFQKIKYLRNNIHTHDYWWWTGCDSLITNFNIDVADIIHDHGNYHFIVATDRNGLNIDSFLIKNSKESIEFLDAILSVEHIYKNHSWFEQQAIIDLIPRFQNIVKFVPQRTINSYDYNLYPPINDNKDKLGNIGQWNEGDLLIHWPGTTLEKRIELANDYLGKVIK